MGVALLDAILLGCVMDASKLTRSFGRRNGRRAALLKVAGTYCLVLSLFGSRLIGDPLVNSSEREESSQQVFW